MNLAAPEIATTTTAPATPRGPARRPRPQAVPIVVAVLVAALLLAAVAYMFGQLWISSGNALATAASERAAVAYARPLNKLLAALADAQYAAARRTAVDPSGVRAAVAEVDGVDRRSNDPLRVRQRWTRLADEIESALAQTVSGADALRAYAAPIALTQALLDRVAYSSQAAGDVGAGSSDLIDVAMQRLPDVVASAGLVAALAFTADGAPTPTSARSNLPPDRRLSVALDRLARAADDVGIGLRAGTDPAGADAIGLRLLGPLDEFSAAAEELGKTAAESDVGSGEVRDRVDAASTRVKTAALALGTAVLDAFDSRVTASVSRYAGQRRVLLLAGVVIALAVGALLWLRVPGPVALHLGRSGSGGSGSGGSGSGGSGAGGSGAGGAAGGRHSYPADDDVGPEGSRRIASLVDARELLSPDLAQLGRVEPVWKRQGPDDHQ